MALASFDDPLRLVIQDAAQKDGSLALDQIGKPALEQAHDHRRKNISHHQRRFVKGELSFSDLIHRTNGKDELLPHFVCIGIFARVLHRPGIDIHTQYLMCAQLDRGDRENAGAAANIDHGRWTVDGRR